jgi:hypothetical protein
MVGGERTVYRYTIQYSVVTLEMFLQVIYSHLLARV